MVGGKLTPIIGTGRIVCATVRCPSVCLSVPARAHSCCRFAAVCPAGRRYRSIAARPALSSSGVRRPCECGQCHVVSVARKLNGDSLYLLDAESCCCHGAHAASCSSRATSPVIGCRLAQKATTHRATQL